jgi:hypothetical protein
MDILYKNRSIEDQDFIRYVCNDILSIKYKNKTKSNLFAGIFVDGRDRYINTLEDYTCFHSFYTFSEYSYPIYAFVHNIDNFLDNNFELIEKYNIHIQKIDVLNSLEDYSNFYIKKVYFEILDEIEHTITLQPDAMLIKSGYEEYLLKHNFIYVGAPWLHSPAMEIYHENTWKQFLKPVRIGNGGFSYRKASFCKWASKNFGNENFREKFADNNKKPQEDLFYSVIANHFPENMPNIEQCLKFSIDPLDKIDYNNKTSFGFHYFSAINPWKV